MKKLFSIEGEGSTKGSVIFGWSPKGTHIAIAGPPKRVLIYDRSGSVHDEILLTQGEGGDGKEGDDKVSSCLALEWDGSGDKLAVLPRASVAVIVYSIATRERTRVDAGMRDLSLLTWSRALPVLAVATAKGNLLLYNDKLSKKVPIVGKHTKRITCGAWSGERLALGSADNQVSISQGDSGDTVRQLAVKAEAVEVAFSDWRSDEDRRGGPRKEDTTVSVNVGRRTLFLCKVAGRDGVDDVTSNPVELAFQEQYGMIQRHRWFGEGYVMLGFSSGYLVVISTYGKELSQEVHSARHHREAVSDIAYCRALERIASCAGNSVKVMDVSGGEYKQVTADCIELEAHVKCDRLQWTAEGQVLTVSTTDGDVHSFLASLPVINDAHETRIAYLTSLLELSIIDVMGQGLPVEVEVSTEPAFCALGPLHVAVGMNNQVWYYRIDGSASGKGGQLECQRDYLGTVEEVRVNNRYAAVLSEGRVELHFIVPTPGNASSGPGAGGGGATEGEGRVFPEKGNTADITTVRLTDSFLIYGTRKGGIHYLFLGDSGAALVNEYRHVDGGIRRLWPNTSGTRLLFEDDRHLVFLYNPVNDQVLPVPEWHGTLERVLWDVSDQHIFVLADSASFSAYAYAPVTLSGPTISPLGTTPRPFGHCPVVLCLGTVTCQLKSGSLENVMLSTHNALQDLERKGREEIGKRFAQNLSLLHLKEAFDDAVLLKTSEAWDELAQKALWAMEVETAMRAYRARGNAGMVMSLAKIALVEDKNLLAGHITLLLGADYDAAQDLFLKSSQPAAALAMRQDLKQWDQALKLAKQLAPERVSDISREYAQMLEMQGEHDQALQFYEKSLQHPSRNIAHDYLSQAGIARTTMQLGNIRRGKQLAAESDNLQLCRDCAAILESMNQLQDAAELYEKGGLYEKAATIYIQSKLFAQAQPLMARITTPKLHIQYAKAKEAEGKYDQAIAAYEAAKNMDNVVRLLLGPLKNPQKAFAVVRKARSLEGATMAARHCQEVGDFAGAIEFLVMTKRVQEAFDLAQQHDKMDAYASFVSSTASSDEFLRLAKYYESKGAHGQAAEMYEKCKQHKQALKLFLRCGTTAEIEKAIDMVGRLRTDSLTSQLVDYLMGEREGRERSHTHLFRLHMALGNQEQAAKTAVLISRQEQDMGNYKIAHQQLLHTIRQLQDQGKKPPSELSRQLMLLHSYILVKTLVKLGDHKSSARMLMRVARNISKFPAHVVPILTSTVIECQRAGLKKTAFEYASMLMRPEYRSQIAGAYKKKIENIVRRPEKVEEEESLSACPFCSLPIADTLLDCPSCKSTLPYCIASGRHMILGDWAFCPHCQFPAIASELSKLVESERACPMCLKAMEPESVTKVADPLAVLKKLQWTSTGNVDQPLPLDTTPNLVI